VQLDTLAKTVSLYRVESEVKISPQEHAYSVEKLVNTVFPDKQIPSFSVCYDVDRV
jgi:hypothetical protein